MLTSVGATRSAMLSIDLKADTDIRSIEQFKQMIVKADQSSIIRLQDIADVELGAENYTPSARFTGKNAVFLSVYLRWLVSGGAPFGSFRYE